MYSALLCLLPLAQAATYPLAESWAGNNFFNGFNPDPSTYDNTTSGDVFWAGPSNSTLNYVNSAGRVIMKVDNISFVPYNEKRYAPKILSKTAYPLGTVWVMDAVHLPYGCSVWPAYWTQGYNWPAGGEIDIMEGVNLQATNQIALHAEGTCTATQNSSASGTLTYNNCAVGTNNDSGCTYNDTNTDSYGAGFAAAGGGVYVTEFAETGINVWFLTRSAVPSSLSVGAGSLDTSTLGEPVAAYGASSCNIPNLFTNQILTLDITLCGTFAGVPSILEETCPPLVASNTCYTTYVINDAEQTYANAYFEINYINVYSTSLASNLSSNSSGNPTSTASIGPSGSAAATGTGKSAGSRQWGVSLGGILFALISAWAVL